MAIRNTPEAQLEMGFNYLNGKNGYPEDDAKALTYFKAAADFNDAMGMCMVGEMHQYGYGTETDYDEAFKWYKRSAEKGCGRAAFRLGWLYANALAILARHEAGWTNKKTPHIQYDAKLARYYYKRAGELGYRDSEGIIEAFMQLERIEKTIKPKSWKNVKDRQEIKREFEKLYKYFYPDGYNMYVTTMASGMKFAGDTTGESVSSFDIFLGLLDHPAYVENGVVKKVDSYNIEDNAFSGLIMKVAYGMLEGDLEHLLSKCTDLTNDCNSVIIYKELIRIIYAKHHISSKPSEQHEQNVTPVRIKPQSNMKSRKQKSATLTPTTDSVSPSSTSSSSSSQQEEKDGDSGIVNYLILGAGGAMLGGPIGLGVGLWLAHKLDKK